MQYARAMAHKAQNGALKDRPGRGGQDNRSRADEKIGSGPKGKKKVITQPEGTDSDGDLSQRGMTSDGGRMLWKKTGLKVPTDVHGNHKGH